MAPVLGYEPWGLRLIESIKDSVANNIPVLIRFHSAADYPCGDGLKLDMESHCVMIIGYDDEKESFIINDPWKKSLGGSRHGIYSMPYKHLPLMSVNGSLGAALRISVYDTEVTTILGDNNNKEIELTIGYFTPKGYVIDKAVNTINAVECIMTLKDSDEKFKASATGHWHAGEKVMLRFNLGNSELNEMNLNFAVRIVVSGDRPYHYIDNQSISFEIPVAFSNVVGSKKTSRINCLIESAV